MLFRYLLPTRILGFVLVLLVCRATNSLNLPPAINNNNKKKTKASSLSPSFKDAKEEASTTRSTTTTIAPSPRSRHTSQFQAKQNHPTTYDDSPTFKGPIVLDRDSSASTSEFHTRVSQYYSEIQRPIPTEPVKACSPTKSTTAQMLKTIADQLAYRDAPIDVKEVAESMEFFLRTRKRLLGAARQQRRQRRQKSASNNTKNTNHDNNHQNENNQQQEERIQLLDCCAGHGFTGMLFAACNPYTVETILIDTVEPASHRKLKTILAEVCPWVEETVTFRAMTLQTYQETYRDSKEGDEVEDNGTPPISSLVIATHACGDLTDQVLDIACCDSIRAAGIAVMPCCYTGTAANQNTPYGIKRALGVSWAADIRRSFFLMDQGYHSDVCAIPAEITPMNRILTGELRK